MNELSMKDGDLAGRLVEPQAAQLEQILDEMIQMDRDNPEALVLAALLRLVELVPVFESTRLSPQIAVCLRSCGGLSCLLAALQQGKPAQVNSWLAMINSTLTGTIVLDLWSRSPAAAEKLFCGSRLMNVVAACSSESWLGDRHKYGLWLGAQLVHIETLPGHMLTRALHISPSVVQPMLPQRIALSFAVRELVGVAKAEVLRAVVRALSTNPPMAGAVIAELLSFEKSKTQISSLLLLTAGPGLPLFHSEATRFARAITVAARALGVLVPVARELVKRWSDACKMGLASPRLDAETRQVVAAACALDAVAAKEIAREPDFIEAVSSNFESLSEPVRKMGALVAELFARKSGDDLRFGMKHENWWLGVDTIPEKIDINNMPQIPAPETEVSELSGLVGWSAENVGSTAADSDDDSQDSDMDATVAPLLYIKDLCAYLRGDVRQRIVALNCGATLVRRKADFGKEVEQYSDELLRTAAGLNEVPSVADFTARKQALIASVLAAVPSKAQLVCEILVTGDLSVVQRSTLLSSLVLAAHNLANYDEAEKLFVGERLPPEQHIAFASHEVGARILKEVSRKTGEELVPAMKAVHITDEQTLWRSKVLEKPTNTKVNMFSASAGKFFFPLAVLGPRSQGFGGSYAPLLHSQWLKTLALFMYYADPCGSMGDIAGQMLEIILAHRSEREPIVVEGVYTAALVLGDVAGGLLVSRWQRELILLADWVAKTWQTIEDEQVASLGAGTLLKLQQLLNSIY